MTRRSGRLAVLGLGAVLVALVAAGFVLVTRPSTPTAALAAPHFVEEASAAGVDQVYDGDFTSSVGGGVAVFDCNDDGKPDMYVAGGSNPAALYRNDGPVGGALHFSPVHDQATDLTGVNGAYRSTSTATAASTWRSCASARTSSCGASATAASSGPTRPGRSTAVTPGTRHSAPRGKARIPCRRSLSGDT